MIIPIPSRYTYSLIRLICISWGIDNTHRVRACCLPTHSLKLSHARKTLALFSYSYIYIYPELFSFSLNKRFISWRVTPLLWSLGWRRCHAKWGDNPTWVSSLHDLVLRAFIHRNACFNSLTIGIVDFIHIHSHEMR